MGLYKYNDKQRIASGIATCDGRTYHNGQIIASRKTRDDAEPVYLVKFKGKGTPLHVTESNITEKA